MSQPETEIDAEDDLIDAAVGGQDGRAGVGNTGNVEGRKWPRRELVQSAVRHNRSSDAVTAENDNLLQLRIVHRLRCEERAAQHSQSDEPEKLSVHVLLHSGSLQIDRAGL